MEYSLGGKQALVTELSGFITRFKENQAMTLMRMFWVNENMFWGQQNIFPKAAAAETEKKGEFSLGELKFLMDASGFSAANSSEAKNMYEKLKKMVSKKETFNKLFVGWAGSWVM